MQQVGTNNRVKLDILFVSLLLVTSCATPTGLRGRLHENMYTSPRKTFRVPVPKLDPTQRVIDEDNGENEALNVRTHTDFFDVVTKPFDPAPPEFTKMGKEKFLLWVFATKIAPAAYLSASPNAAIQKTEYLPGE